jgi:isopentenyldiphosphate isomerase
MEPHKKAEYLAAVPSLYDIYVGNFENAPVLRNEHNSASHLHLVAGLFVYNPVTRQFLVQQRSASKNTYPEHFTDSASGHINARAGMSLATIKEEMCRELAEEMGVKAKPGQLSLWTLFQDAIENEIKLIFVACVDTTKKRLDLAEVTDRSGWYATIDARCRAVRQACRRALGRIAAKRNPVRRVRAKPRSMANLLEMVRRATEV